VRISNPSVDCESCMRVLNPSVDCACIKSLTDHSGTSDHDIRSLLKCLASSIVRVDGPCSNS
jgi:hypothetical protein